MWTLTKPFVAQEIESNSEYQEKKIENSELKMLLGSELWQLQWEKINIIKK